MILQSESENSQEDFDLMLTKIFNFQAKYLTEILHEESCTSIVAEDLLLDHVYRNFPLPEQNAYVCSYLAKNCLDKC